MDRRRVGVVIVGFFALAAACSSGTSLETAAASALGADQDEVFFDQQIGLEPSACILAPAWDTNSTNPYPLVFVVLADETVLEGFNDETVRQTLDSCFFDPGLEPDVQTMVRLVVSVARTPGPIAAAKPTDSDELAALGVPYTTPTLSTEDGMVTVRFLAVDLEIGEFYSVTAGAAPGTFTAQYEPISS